MLLVLLLLLLLLLDVDVVECNDVPFPIAGDNHWNDLTTTVQNTQNRLPSFRNVILASEGQMGMKQAPFRSWVAVRIESWPDEMDISNSSSSSSGSPTIRLFVRLHNKTIGSEQGSFVVKHDNVTLATSWRWSYATELRDVSVGMHTIDVELFYPNHTRCGNPVSTIYIINQNHSLHQSHPMLDAASSGFSAGQPDNHGGGDLMWPWDIPNSRLKPPSITKPKVASVVLLQPTEGSVYRTGQFTFEYVIMYNNDNSSGSSDGEFPHFASDVLLDGMNIHSGETSHVSEWLRDIEPGEHDIEILVVPSKGWSGIWKAKAKFHIYKEPWVYLASYALSLPHAQMYQPDDIKISSPRFFEEFSSDSRIEIRYHIHGFQQFASIAQDLRIELYLEGRGPSGTVSSGWGNVAPNSQFYSELEANMFDYYGEFYVADCLPGFHKATVAIVRSGSLVVLSSATVIFEVLETWNPGSGSTINSTGDNNHLLPVDTFDLLSHVTTLPNLEEFSSSEEIESFKDDHVLPTSKYDALGHMEIRYLGIIFRISGAPLHPRTANGSKRDLLIGAQDKLHLSDIYAWFSSFRSVNPDAHVVLFSGQWSPELEQACLLFGVSLVYYEAGSLFWVLGVVGNHRFSLYRDFLWMFYGQYNRVMFADVRDVLFQQNPFSTIPINDGIAIFLEPNTLRIGECKAHKTWLHDETVVYEFTHVYSKLAPYYRSCSGITMGTAEAMLRYSMRMVEELHRTVLLSLLTRSLSLRFTPDQGPHNFLIWSGSLSVWNNVTTYSNEEGPLLTMQSVFEYQVSNSGLVINDGGHVIPVLHQFDRHKERLHYTRTKHGGPDYMAWESREYNS